MALVLPMSPETTYSKRKEWEIMKKGLLTIMLGTLVLASAAWGAQIEKPALDNTLKGTPVMLTDLSSRVTLLQEGFEAAVPPAGWTIMTSGASYTWAQAGIGNSGAASAWVAYGPYGAFQDEWLVAPAVDASALNSLTLEFAENEDYWADWGLYHDIMVSTTVPDDPAAFTSVLQMTPGNHVIDGWSLMTVNLDAYAGEPVVYVAFRYQGDYADNWYIDDVRLFEPFEHDVAFEAITPVSEYVVPGTMFDPVVTVENIGQNTETFDVNLLVTLDGMVVADNTVTVTDLAVGSSSNVAFPSFTTMVGNYTLTATTLLPTDLDTSNDMGVGLVTCWTEERTPFGILYTEWGCGPCVGANQALDAWYPLQGNDATLMRVHVWWPSGSDPMYAANPLQAQYLHGMTPTTVNGVPTPYLDNYLDVWTLDFATWEDGIQQAYGLSSQLPSPLTMDLGYNNVTGEVEVFVDVENPLMPGGDYRLFVAITEDGVQATGPNGEPVHNQTFRKLYPGEGGLPLGGDKALSMYSVPVDVDPSWTFEQLRAVAWVQEYPGGIVLNAATRFMSEGVVGIDDDFADDIDQDSLPTLATKVSGAYPNPFNPMTTVKFSVAREQHVKLSVFNMNGQRVATLTDGVFAAGEYPVQWNGTDSAGRGVASGNYIVHMVSEDGVSTSKIMLVR
jgi:hypothetical protein